MAKNTEIKNIIIVDSLSMKQLFGLADWVLNHNKTLNQFYYARQRVKTREEYEQVSILNTTERMNIVHLYFSRAGNDNNLTIRKDKENEQTKVSSSQ